MKLQQKEMREDASKFVIYLMNDDEKPLYAEICRPNQVDECIDSLLEKVKLSQDEILKLTNNVEYKKFNDYE